MTTDDQLKPYYEAYIKASGLPIKFTLGMRYYFERLHFEGFSPTDVSMVISYIKRRIKSGRRERESLLPRNALADTDKFSEDLSMARSDLRSIQSRPSQAKQSVLNSTGRPFVPPENTMSVHQVMVERLKMADMLKNWKESNL